jgi:diguanylate cyclase (GGDEF)-like protein
LSHYARTGDESAYGQYERAIAYPRNLERARLALDRKNPDVPAAREALAASGIDPADVGSVIWVFRTFRHVGYFAEAVDYWTRGDALVDRLVIAGTDLRGAKGADGSRHADVDRLTNEIWRINTEIAPISHAFANVLGAAFRQTALMLFIVNLVVAVFLVCLSAWCARCFITARLAVENALRRSEARAQATLGSIGEAVISIGPTGLVEFVNPAAERLMCRASAQCTGRPLHALITLSGENDRRQIDLLDSAFLDQPERRSGQDLILTDAHGIDTAVQAVTSVMHDATGTPTGVVLLLRNMTREREYVASLAWQATHDRLTGLVNRTEFEQRLGASLDPDSNLADVSRARFFLFLDLDHFKVVNDTFGHAAGDALLREVVSRGRQCLREKDTLGRLWGDEFGVLLCDCGEDAALQLAERLRRELAFEWIWETQRLWTSVSIGVVHLRQGGLDVEMAMRYGDIACYLAKERGRDLVHLAVPGDKELNRHAGEMSWCGRIKDALAENRFCLYAQPIRATGKAASGKEHSHDADAAPPEHVEILLRMIGAGGKLISPGAFMPAAERYGLMPAIDRWVVRAVFAKLEKSVNAGDCQYAINLSGASIGDERFLKFLIAEFASTGVSPASICFEITETTAVASLATAARFIRELKQRGCKFALDDFGAGMSSFGYLKHLPVDYVKIDGSFVKDILNDAANREMVAAINDIGHSMGRLTIAEYVESEAILHALREMGLDFVQGFHVGRPTPWATEEQLSPQHRR